VEEAVSVDLDKIAALVQSARGQADELASVYDRLAAELPAGSCEPWVCKVDEYVIELGLGPTRFVSEIEALRTVFPLGLAIAPRIAGVYSTDECQVLVKRYGACPGERLRRVYDSDVQFDAAQRSAFRRDLDRLADAGYMHGGAHRGVGYWLYGESSKTLVLGNWEMLRPLESRVAVFESIDHYLTEYAT
jgi:hypothetical protein